MKKDITLIAGIVLIILNTDAIGQVESKTMLHQQGRPSIPAKQKAISLSESKKGKVQTPSSYAMINYVLGDEIVSGEGVASWFPSLYINSQYTLKDTVFSPYASSKANITTANSCTVTFDTLWDAYTQNFISPVVAGSMQIDTIWGEIVYKNSSGLNDTLIISINSVSAAGFPAGTTYQTETIIIPPASFTYNSTDSVQLVYFVPATPIIIPSTATHGWNFCINATISGSKSDTIGFWYYSQIGTCISQRFTSAYTAIGVKDGRATNVNSFVDGLYWFNSASLNGNGTSLTWPNYTTYPGYCINSGTYYFYDQQVFGCTGDSSYCPWQDIAIFASVEYTHSVTTGNISLSQNGLSVSQNYPNPFNKTTQINYSLTKSSDVTFSVYDMTGRVLVNNVYTNSAPGTHTINLSANSFSPGVYFYTFNVNGNKVTNKMVITE